MANVKVSDIPASAFVKAATRTAERLGIEPTAENVAEIIRVGKIALLFRMLLEQDIT